MFIAYKYIAETRIKKKNRSKTMPDFTVKSYETVSDYVPSYMHNFLNFYARHLARTGGPLSSTEVGYCLTKTDLYPACAGQHHALLKLRPDGRARWSFPTSRS